MKTREKGDTALSPSSYSPNMGCSPSGGSHTQQESWGALWARHELSRTRLRKQICSTTLHSQRDEELSWSHTHREEPGEALTMG